MTDRFLDWRHLLRCKPTRDHLVAVARSFEDAVDVVPFLEDDLAETTRMTVPHQTLDGCRPVLFVAEVAAQSQVHDERHARNDTMPTCIPDPPPALGEHL